MNEFPPSKAPRFPFAETLAEQEDQLRRNPLLQRMREARRAKSDDRHRPRYHYVNPEYTLNDPNGLCFWQGRWHLFYQARPPEDPRQHWGHAVSPDLIHWRDLPYAIGPGPEERCYSGTALVEGGPGDRHVPRGGSREHGGRFPRPAAVELAETDGAPGHTVRVRG